MIRFDAVSVTYPDAPAPALSGVDLVVAEGELVVVAGRTGSGKSTLLRCVNGLVPHFSGGRLAGRVTVNGRDTRDVPPRELADVVGLVGQDPAAGFVSDNVEEEIAYSGESLGLAAAVMRRRVEEILDLVGLADLRDRPLATLSGGQQQRVAIGSALTTEPRILVLDEPTSALDPAAAEDVLAVVHRLVHDLGVTVLISEHRLERVAQYADRVAWLPGDGAPLQVGLPGPVLAESPVAPPVVRLGRLVGWDPPPVSVRDARIRAGPLRDRLGPAPAGTIHPETHPLAHTANPGSSAPSDAPVGPGRPSGPLVSPVRVRVRVGVGPSSAHLQARAVSVRYPQCDAVRGVDLTVGAGERVAVMGRNGSGKSSLLWALQGSGPRHGGMVTVTGRDPAGLRPHERRRLVGLLPQQPSDLLYLETVDEECEQADRESGAATGSARALLDRIAPRIDADRHPRDLSEGQRLSVALAVTLAAAPHVVLLDEPTRGLDYPSKVTLAEVLRELSDDQSRAVILATHDVEFVAEFATRVVIMAGGEVVADGEATDVITSSSLFAPQVAKVLAPHRWITVAQVESALARTPT